MGILLSEPETLPSAKLPSNFKKRIATLAPLRLVNGLSKVCPEVEKLRPIHPDVYDQVFITDWVYRWASNNTIFFQIFQLYYQFALIRVMVDGYYSINSVWRTVLRVDDVEQQKRHIYVKDTLVLNCKTLQSYEKVIPLICGPYHKLILLGNITWNQVKQLVHPGVRQVRIDANLALHWKEYDDFAHFWFKQAHELDYR
uniref:Gamma-glutamylcysteine synthetase regulatory subunit n=1 Tax=Panagrellus redivivus TaxID=6233 RepID=A0A7E4V2H6_PANRE